MFDEKHIHLPSNSDNHNQFPNRRNQYTSSWTIATDDLLRKHWHEGLSIRDIAIKMAPVLGYSLAPATIGDRATRIGLPRRPPTNWDKDSEARLEVLWKDLAFPMKHMHLTINAEFGTTFTRSSMIGKAHRMKLPNRRLAVTEEVLRARIQKRIDQKRGKSAERTQRLPKPVKALPVNDLDIPVAQRKTILEITDYNCKYVVGDPTMGAAHYFYCGADLPHDRDLNTPPYCPGHAKVCFQPHGNSKQARSPSAFNVWPSGGPVR